MTYQFSFDQQTPRERRTHILLMALFYSAITIFCGCLVVLAVYSIANGQYGYLIMLTLFGFFGFLTSILARHYLSDLKAETMQVEGEISRKWHKGNLFIFFMPSYYIQVDDRIFGVSRLEYVTLLEDDLVRVRCYPHSLTVEEIERYDETRDVYVPARSGELG
jgi:hypothetical protein